MEVFMKEILPILVLMVVGTGFMYIHIMQHSLPAFVFVTLE